MNAVSPSIVWLASYPGSGNTWVRVFLCNLLAPSDTPADINALTGAMHAASRSWFDGYAGVRTGDLTQAEIDELRPHVYETLAAEEEPPLFLKIHDKFSYLPSGAALVPLRASRGAICIIRNPLDVAPSYANHRNTGLDAIVRIMADDSHAIAARAGGVFPQLRQHVGSWSGHVQSWADAPMPVHVVRYEELKADPVHAFGAIAAFSGIPHTPADLHRAIRFSAFPELRRQEDAAGFRERSRQAARFFRRGESGAWRDELTSAHVEQIIAAHGPVMKRFGYLAKDGPV